MHFEANHIYHVYNRGNNKVRIFFTPANYLFLLKKVKAEWQNHCDIICYCLMPNHFHFMIRPNQNGCLFIKQKEQISYLQNLSKVIGKTLSSYTQAINIQNNTIGTLFQKKTKAKCITDDSINTIEYKKQDYLINCFHYIHQNPIESGLVKNLRDWMYSSWPDYYGLRNGTLCKREIFIEEAGYSVFDFNTAAKIEINKEVIKGIW